MKWHEPREAEIECVLSRGDRRMGRVLHTAWKSGVRFDGWSEHFRYDLWMKAFEAEGIPKESYLREYALDEILPWDVLDVSIRKRFLEIELIKAKKEMRTEDCKWGHCYACGVPGNGEDTVLAQPMPTASLPTFDASARREAERSCRLSRRRQGRGVPAEGDAGSAVGRAARARPGRPRLPLPGRRSRRPATRGSSRTATRWTSSSARSAPRDCRRATPRGSTRT